MNKKAMLIIFLLCIGVASAIPQKIGLLFELKDPAGGRLTGTYDIKFSIYDAYTGGNLLWNETQEIRTDAGLGEVILGAEEPVNLTFDSNYYLGITVESDSEMIPRINLTSTPYAYRSNTSDQLDPNNNYTVNDLTADNLYLNDHLEIGGQDPQAQIQTQIGKTSEFGYIDSPFLRAGEYYNYLLQTEVFGTTWTQVNLSSAVGANTADSPLGTTIAEIIPAGTDYTGAMKQSVTNETLGNWTFSVWLKSSSGTPTVSLRIDTSGAVGSEPNNVTLSTIWKRYAVTRDITETHTTKTVVINHGTNAIIAWGAQLDPHSEMRPYSGPRTTTALTTASRILYAPTAASFVGALGISGALTGATTFATSSTYTASRTNIITTSTDSVILSNAQAATAAVPVQYSPRLRFSGTVWNTEGNARSNTSNFIVENRPISGNPTSASLLWQYMENSIGSTYHPIMSMSNEGVLNSYTGIIIGNDSSTYPYLTFNSASGDLNLEYESTLNTLNINSSIRSNESITATKNMTSNNYIFKGIEGLVIDTIRDTWIFKYANGLGADNTGIFFNTTTAQFQFRYMGTSVFAVDATDSSGLYLNGESADDDDTIYFDDGTQYFRWDNLFGGFNLSSDLKIPYGHTIYFNATDEIEISPSRFQLPGVNPPAQAILGLSPVLSFDKSTNESAYASLHVHPKYLPGSEWAVEFYWSPDDTGTGDVLWCIEAYNMSAETNTVINAAGNINCIIDSGQGTAKELLESGKIYAPGIKEDDQVSFRVFRGADDERDTFDADAHLVEASIYFTNYRLGS